MTSPQSLSALTVLLERYEMQRDAALLQARQARQRAEAARGQAEQLSSYRGEYQQRWAQNFSQQTTVQILGCYQSFGSRLDEAISSQGNVASHAGAALERAEALLRDCEQRVAAVRKLIERRRHEDEKRARMLEQRNDDEQAARSALHAHHHGWRTPV